jgi:hypothetical protein
MNKKLNDKYLQKMNEVKLKYKDDEEVAHYKADNILCDLLDHLGYTKLVEVFYSIDKWYA